MHPDSPALRALRTAGRLRPHVHPRAISPDPAVAFGVGWTPAQPEYLQMILAIYATLGVFLLRAAREPLNHLSLLWFTVWSSVAHALVMAVHALRDPTERGHLPGDVLVLLLVALLLGVLTARAAGSSGKMPPVAGAA